MVSYNTLIRIHRFLVKFMIFFGLIMLVTGMAMKFNLDPGIFRLIHFQTSTFFAPIFSLMLLTGTLMYFYPKFTRHNNSWKVKLLAKKTVARETMEFTFEKPRGFSFIPGQHLEWLELNPPETDAEGENRTFTISSAPFEKNLAFTTRMRDTAYKRVLKNLSRGDEIQISGLEGDFVLPTNQLTSHPIVMLAGGIGITPFRSMLVQNAHDKTNQEIYLFYSNHKIEDTAFLEELTDLAKKHSWLHLFPIFTDKSGYLKAEAIKKALKNFRAALYFISGPPQMVLSTKEMLTSSLKISPNSILTDNFTGY